jgi:hypothetical protein
MTSHTRSRYSFTLFCWFLGVTIAVAFVIGGKPGEAIFSAALFGAIGLAFLLGGRSETVRVVRGDLPDERWQMHDLRATAIAGLVLIFAVLGAWIVQVARGRSGSPYDALGAVAGVSYLVAIVVLRLRG